MTQRAPMLGYRVWAYTPDGRLTGVFHQHEWAGTAAVCDGFSRGLGRPHHEAPVSGCKCGWNAYFSLARALASMGGPRYEMGEVGPVPRGRVLGAVVALPRGRIITLERGWRAMYANPVALVNDGRSIVGTIGNQYGIPTVALNKLELVSQEFGEAYR